jgi:hypothetical protein
MFGFVLATALFACAEAPLGGDTGDTLQEWWSCSHVESQYSALVIAETTVEGDWSSIEFMVYDDDQFHTLELFDYDNGLWRIEANLMDLDCYSDDIGGDFVYIE